MIAYLNFIEQNHIICNEKPQNKDMPKLKFVDQNEEFELPENSPIVEACEQAGVPFACTEGVCGTCVIEVKEGMENLTEFTQEEEDFLGELETERLACQCKIKSGDVSISF